jgi:6-phosphogluconolactonase (cycloisomerase 2 family)
MKKIVAITLACAALHLELWSFGCFTDTPGVQSIRSLESTSSSIAYSHSAQFVAAPHSQECVISLYQKNDGSDNLELLQTVETSGFPFFVAFSPDDSHAAVTHQMQNGVGENGITVYRIDSETGKWQLIQTISGTLENFPYCISYSPDGRFIAVTDVNGHFISIYRVAHATGKLSLLHAIPSDSPFHMLTFSPDGRFLAATQRSSAQVCIYRVDPRTAALTEIEGSPFLVTPEPDAISYQHSGAFIAITHKGDEKISIYEVNEVNGAISNVQYIPAGTIACGEVANLKGEYIQ